ncbi:MAG: DUF1707 domain-containing protein [Streptosporangiaceae bacterium]|jgi:hypothetical protein
MAPGPDLRIGDADRDRAAASLREHFAQGRLSLEEFNQRIDAVFAATTQSQLYRINSDLPHVLTAEPLPVAAPRQQREDGRHGQSAGRPRMGALASLAAVLITFFLFLVVLSPDLSGIPSFGRFGILLLLFGIVRGLFRRILGGGRGRGRRG